MRVLLRTSLLRKFPASYYHPEFIKKMVAKIVPKR